MTFPFKYGSEGNSRGRTFGKLLVGVWETSSLHYFWAANLVPRNSGSQFMLLLGRKLAVYATFGSQTSSLRYFWVAN